MVKTQQQFKKTPAGEIPVSWEPCKFGQLVQIQEGLVSPLKHPYAEQIHIGANNIVIGGGLKDNLLTCEEIGLTSGKYKFEPGAIIYSKIRPNLNKVCRVNFRGVCSANAYPIYAKQSICYPDYLLCYMRSNPFVRRAVATSMRTGMPKVNRLDLEKIDIPLPPLPEQQKIAEILSAWDDALNNLDTLIQAQQQRKKALMQQLLTGKKRLPGFRGGWKTYKLDELFKQRKETKRGDLPLLSITASQGVIKRDQLTKKDSSNADKSKYQRIARGDIGYNTMRMWQGVSALSSLEGIVSPAYTICTPSQNITGEFTAHFFKLPHTISLFHRYSQGLVADTLNLKYPNFSVIQVSIPTSIKEQTAIANILTTCDKEITLLQEQHKSIEKQKRGLMQQLLTGKIRTSA